MMQRGSAVGLRRENPRAQMEAIALAIARTVLVWIRKPRTISPEMLPSQPIVKMGSILAAGGLIVSFPLLAWMLGVPMAGGDSSLFVFALAFVGMGLWLRRQHRAEEATAESSKHSDAGISWFEFLPIQQDYVYRFVDPGVVFLAGALFYCRLGFPLLGLWWMISAAALALFEWERHQKDGHDKSQPVGSENAATMGAESTSNERGRAPEAAQGSPPGEGADANPSDCGTPGKETAEEAAHEAR
jgi:hypothetical protein